MKHVLKAFLPLAAAVTLVACGNNETKTEAANEHAGHASETSTTENTPSGSVTIKDEATNAVYQHYVHLTTALTNTDAAEAKVAANAIEAGAKEMKDGGAIAAAAGKIANAKDIEAQRAAYEDLSKEMMAKIKSAGVQGGELYVQYCPMAFNDKGASWISSNKEIRNPYFGKKMMTCGEVKETIQ